MWFQSSMWSLTEVDKVPFKCLPVWGDTPWYSEIRTFVCLCFIPLEHKFGLVYTLLHCCFCLVSDMSKFHFEIEKLKEILLSNGYSNKFIDKCISKFMNKLYIKKPVMLTVPKKQLYLVLPFMGKMSALVKSGLARSLHKRLPFVRLKLFWRPLIFWEIILALNMLLLNLYVLAKFIILHVGAAILHILVKPLGT